MKELTNYLGNKNYLFNQVLLAVMSLGAVFTIVSSLLYFSK